MTTISQQLQSMCKVHGIFCEKLHRDAWLLHCDGPSGPVSDCTICTTTREALEIARDWADFPEGDET